MTTSTIDICNMAMDLLGADPITSLDDDIQSARLCRRNFGRARDAVLRAYPWNSAMRRATLAATTVAPGWGYDSAFNLPEGPNPPFCLRVWQIEGEIDWGRKYKVEGRQILVDGAGPLNIVYIARIEDVSQFDSLLTDAIAARMAADLGYPITQSTSLARSLYDVYGDKLREAREIDASEGSADAFTAREWLESRV